MIKYILQRLFAMAITLFIIISICFFIIRMMPGDFIDDSSIPEEVRVVMKARYNLDKPLIQQYLIFVKNFVTFDFGESMKLYPRKPVFNIIWSKIPTTMQLNLFSLCITIPVGICCGIIAAIKKNTKIDHMISIMVIFFVSVPSFVFASVLQYFVAFKWGLVPILVNTSTTLTLEKFVSMILPILALSFGGIATITRYMRAELCESLNSEYMLLSKAKGLPQIQSVVRHALRNSFIPLANVIIPMFMNILGGSMVIEGIFGIPGIGSLTVSSINTMDHYLTISVLFFYSIISLTTVLLVDLSYGIIDPRIRIGGGKISG